MRPYILAETNWKAVQEAEFDLAVLQWGATEAHNYHLPYATDNYETEHITAEAARLAWERGTKAIVLPIIPFGVNTGQLDIKFCINLNPSTQFEILKDVLDALSRHGIKKFVLMNGHGGNNFRQMVRECQALFPEMFLCTVNWFDAAPWKDFVEDLGDHAGELETSLMQAIAPDLVLPLSEAGDGAAKRPKITAMREGWVWAQRPWTKVTKDTGVGDPAKAAPEKGRAFIKAASEKLAQFFVELGESDVNDLYE